MSPPLSPAQRTQGRAPVMRAAWWCRYPGCRERGVAENGRAARTASLRHYDDTHPQPLIDPGVGNDALAEVET